jgi:hypothetical protein
MTTFGEVAYECPVCGEPVPGVEIHSTNQMDRDTDFCPVTAGLHAVPLVIHACRNCGYAGYGRDFEDRSFDPVQKTRFVAARIPDGLIPLEARLKDLSADHSYYLAYLTRVHFGAPPAELGDLLLRASWCLRLPGGRPEDDVAASRYRREALREFRRALASPGPDVETRRTHAFLVAELLRRQGEFQEAEEAFARFRTDPPEDPEWIQTARALEAACRQHDAGNHTFRELLGT